MYTPSSTFAPVARPQDLFDHPHLLANGSLAPTTLPGGVKTRLPLLPFRMLGWRPPLVSDPPEVGQWLGLLIAFDALFLGLSVLLFDYAIEEE